MAATIACMAMLMLFAGPSHAAKASDIAALKRSSCPEYEQTHESSYPDAQVRDAVERDRFQLLGRPVTLRDPVNWDMDPYSSRSWQSDLQAWFWIDVLLFAYSEQGNVDALRQARNLALDWIKSKPPSSTGLAWADKITGDRTGFLSYVARASGCEGILSDNRAARFIDSAKDHGQYLEEPSNYSTSNHGLFMDAGLILLSQYLPFLSGADRWKELGLRRLEQSYERSVNGEGVHLEHSPGYHFLTAKLLQNILRFTEGSQPELERIHEQMKAVAPWFVMPDGKLTAIGDTALKDAPDLSSESVEVSAATEQQAQAQEGISPTRRGGYAIIKDGGSYLSVFAGHFSAAHKQADELGFELFEDNRRVAMDTGRWGFGRDKNDPSKVAAREFTLSSQGHSVLVADDGSFRIPDQSFYGSGITATGQGSGWYAIEGENPLLRSQGVSHRRLLLYRPGVALIVIDFARSGDRHEYSRYFQLSPDIATSDAPGPAFALHDGSFDGSINDTDPAGDGGAKVVRGQDSPLLGFYSAGGFSGLAPRPTVVYETDAKDVNEIAALGLEGSAPVTADLLAHSDDATSVRVKLPGEATARQVTVSGSGSELQVTETPGA